MANQKKVLIVDDSKLVHQICRVTLMSRKDCSLFDAMNGYEALEILAREQGVDLILLDLNMPAMNGFEFLEVMMKNPLYSETPVIIISSETKQEDMLTARKLGAWAYVAKPRSELLKELIEDALAGQPSPFA